LLFTQGKKSFEFWQDSLKVKVTFNSADFNTYFNEGFKNHCKSFIPKAQTFGIIYYDIAGALPENYEHTFLFEFNSETLVFSFKGFWRNEPNAWTWNEDNTGSAVIVYHPTVTITKGEQRVFKQQDNIRVYWFMILV
jgi:hypothetical protein